MSRRTSFRRCTVAVLAILLAAIPIASAARTITVELTGAVGLIFPVDPSVPAQLEALGVVALAPTVAFISWETETPGVDDPVTGKTVYDGAITELVIEIGSYVAAQELGLPIDDQNAITVGDDREGIATPTIRDTFLALAGGLDTDGILSAEAPDDVGVVLAIGFQGDTSVLFDQSLELDQEAVDLFFEGGAIEAQVGSPKGVIRIGFDAGIVPEPGQGLLVLVGAGVLLVSAAIRRRAAPPGA